MFNSALMLLKCQPFIIKINQPHSPNPYSLAWSSISFSNPVFFSLNWISFSSWFGWFQVRRSERDRSVTPVWQHSINWPILIIEHPFQVYVLLNIPQILEDIFSVSPGIFNFILNAGWKLLAVLTYLNFLYLFIRIRWKVFKNSRYQFKLVVLIISYINYTDKTQIAPKKNWKTKKRNKNKTNPMKKMVSGKYIPWNKCSLKLLKNT